MRIDNEQLRDSVSRGAQLLDATDPTWSDRVDVGRLRVECARLCVLGQLYDNYLTGAAAVGLGTNRDGWYYGFLRPERRWLRLAPLLYLSRERREYRVLTDAWRTAVQLRQRRHLERGIDVARELIDA